MVKKEYKTGWTKYSQGKGRGLQNVYIRKLSADINIMDPYQCPGIETPYPHYNLDDPKIFQYTLHQTKKIQQLCTHQKEGGHP